MLGVLAVLVIMLKKHLIPPMEVGQVIFWSHNREVPNNDDFWKFQTLKRLIF